MPKNCLRRRKPKLYIKCTERNAKERISALSFVVDLITTELLVFTFISSFPGCKFVLRKISIRFKASERVSSFI